MLTWITLVGGFMLLAANVALAWAVRGFGRRRDGARLPNDWAAILVRVGGPDSGACPPRLPRSSGPAKPTPSATGAVATLHQRRPGSSTRVAQPPVGPNFGWCKRRSRGRPALCPGLPCERGDVWICHLGDPRLCGVYLVLTAPRDGSESGPRAAHSPLASRLAGRLRMLKRPHRGSVTGEKPMGEGAGS
jgi:hypothetical protein